MNMLLAAGAPLITLDSHTKLYLWIGIGVYMALMLGIGIFCSKRVSDLKDYLVAGRRLPLWMATATLLATWFGAGSCMGVSASVFKSDLRSVIPDPIAAAISLVLAGFFIVGYLRKYNCLTVTDIIANKYGKGAGVYASFWMLPVYIGWMGAQVLGIGTLLNLLTGINMLWGITIAAGVVLAYTALGGMWAVTMTDVIQVSLIIIGILLIVPGAFKLAGGYHEVMAFNRDNLSLLPEAGGTFNDHVGYLGSWLIMGLGCMVGQDLVQRSLASKTPQIAKTSSIYSGILYMAIGLIPIAIGFCAKIIFAKEGIAIDDAENQVLPYMAYRVLGNMHPLLLTLFYSALLAAIMSSADSSLLAACSLFTNNILKPVKPHLTDKQLLLTTRIAAVVILVVSAVLALSVESIYALMTNSWASQLVVVFFPVIAAIYIPHARKYSIWACMIASTVIWLGFVAWASWQIWWMNGGTFTDLMGHDTVIEAFSTGAVYGFAGGIFVFGLVYVWERIYIHEPDTTPECPCEESASALPRDAA